ncbi:PREDICTED: uncharacterized protein LOC105453663 isoform X3 [Wasmannia auropunctata]|uniref:uncharacterized protein LOC105453663 isoform X3 n=1 Tax=Wasmannia auropunctata TaxID=64793 RepID=UPI0005EF500A|nr:PREDICTED: uncharacterized protein LOC105453663 isoform X3 [Wasmannia auropunctata]
MYNQEVRVSLSLDRARDTSAEGETRTNCRHIVQRYERQPTGTLAVEDVIHVPADCPRCVFNKEIILARYHAMNDRNCILSRIAFLARRATSKFTLHGNTRMEL